MDPITYLLPLGLSAGINLYLTVFVTGLIVRFDWAAQHLPDSLDIYGSLPVLAASGFMVFIEFFADKIPYVDNVWDAIHTFIRPVGAMLIAISVLPGNDPGVTTALALLTGATALTSHTSKAGLRALVNTSPEPFSNVALSTLEDLSVMGMMALVFEYPLIAGSIAAVILVVLLFFLYWLVRFARRAFGSVRRFFQAGAEPTGG